MAITKYGWAHQYGYGFLEGKYGIGFSTNVSVVDKSTPNNEKVVVEPAFKYISLTGKDGKQEGQKLYVVFDGDTWKEYFSGTPIKRAYWKYGETRSRYDGYNGYDFDKRSDLGYREFLITDVIIEEAKDFANEIAKYSDKQIKEMVQQFYTLVENAPKWGVNFDKTVEELRRKRDNANLSSANSLENNVGKYANIKPTGKKADRPDSRIPTDKNNTQTVKKTKSGCLGVLVMSALIILALIALGVFVW